MIHILHNSTTLKWNRYLITFCVEFRYLSIMCVIYPRLGGAVSMMSGQNECTGIGVIMYGIQGAILIGANANWGEILFCTASTDKCTKFLSINSQKYMHIITAGHGARCTSLSFKWQMLRLFPSHSVHHSDLDFCQGLMVQSVWWQAKMSAKQLQSSCKEARFPCGFLSCPAAITHITVTSCVMASHITGVSVVYSIIYSGSDQRKHQSSRSLVFVRGIHRWPVDSPHKGPITQKIFPFDDAIRVVYRIPMCCLTKTSYKLQC